MCVTSNSFYAVIGTSCLSYIFSILSFSVLYFISISEIPDAKSSQRILVFFFFSMRCNMSMDNLKESAALSSSGTAKVETHRAVTQCWGQRLALAFLNLALKHRSLDVLRADDPNS